MDIGSLSPLKKGQKFSLKDIKKYQYPLIFAGYLITLALLAYGSLQLATSQINKALSSPKTPATQADLQINSDNLQLVTRRLNGADILPQNPQK